MTGAGGRVGKGFRPQPHACTRAYRQPRFFLIACLSQPWPRIRESLRKTDASRIFLPLGICMVRIRPRIEVVGSSAVHPSQLDADSERRSSSTSTESFFDGERLSDRFIRRFAQLESARTEFRGPELIRRLAQSALEGRANNGVAIYCKLDRAQSPVRID